MAIGDNLGKDAGVAAVDEAMNKFLPAFNQMVNVWLVSIEAAAESVPRDMISGAHDILDRINGTRVEVEGTAFAVVLKIPPRVKVV